jgi:4-hydroxybenzoate polyprenyltransferase
MHVFDLPADADPARPLIVDLDGTLIHSDLLWESLLLFLKTRLLELWKLPLWLLRGKAGFKAALADAVVLDASVLPYDSALVAALTRARAQGRTLILATGAERRFAEQVAAHLQLFARVLATDDGHNLTSHNKAARLNQLFGAGQYDYIGNARADLAVWRHSAGAFSVGRRPFRLADGRATTGVGGRRPAPLGPLLRALRPRQWLKNLLVFVPMMTGHAFGVDTVLASLLAFVAFSLCASSAYLLNDALDAGDDRRHAVKRHRPIAAGELSLPLALAASAALALAALALCALLRPWLLVVVAIYFATTLGYSLLLKRLLMVDIVTLALLYTLRILGGGASTGIVPSFWLLAFSFFLFLSLALLKRYSELASLHRQGKDKTSGRGYTTADRTPIGIMGITAGQLSVLIFMLYFNSNNVLELYRHPYFLLGVVPLMTFWLGRLWLLSFHGKVNEDPVLYVSKDPVSLATIAACAALAVAATF